MSPVRAPTLRAEADKLLKLCADPRTPMQVAARPDLFDSPELAAAFARAGWFAPRVDRAPVFNKVTLLHAIYQSCEFPAWFGFNWDALRDSLSDLSWCPANGYALLFRNLGLLQVRAPDDYATFIDVAQEACEIWAEASGVPFRLVVMGA